MTVIPIHTPLVQPMIDGLVAQSDEMMRVISQVKRMAATQSPVFISGGSGTGKSMLARAVHKLGAQSQTSFKNFQCRLFADGSDVEELVGSVGSGPGSKSRAGVFKLADGGTVFLANVDSLSVSAQIRLLRLIEDKTYVPVGARGPKFADIRFVASSSRSLPELVRQGLFSEALMYRLQVLQLSVPDMADRGTDIDLLIWHFIEQFNTPQQLVKSISEAARAALLEHHWPGNIRELRNAIEHAHAMCSDMTINIGDLPQSVARPKASAVADTVDYTLESMDRQRIVRALHEAGGRRSRAAEILGISRSTLWRKLRQHKLVASQ